MEKYLKMTDVFKKEVLVDNSTAYTLKERFDKFHRVAEVNDDTLMCSGTSVAEYAAHAINSHDELVAEVERLRDVISKIKNPSNDDCLGFLCAAFRHCDYEIKGDFEIEDMKPAFILYANKKGA